MSSQYLGLCPLCGGDLYRIGAKTACPMCDNEDEVEKRCFPTMKKVEFFKPKKKWRRVNKRTL